MVIAVTKVIHVHVFLSGESPISPASDVDNLNNLTTFDKATLPNGVSSPQVAPNHVIAAKSRPSFDRLLNFVCEID